MAAFDYRQLLLGWWERRQARIERDRAIEDAMVSGRAAMDELLRQDVSTASALLGEANASLTDALCWEHDPDLREIAHLILAAKEHLDWRAADRAEAPLHAALSRLRRLGPCPRCAPGRSVPKSSSEGSQRSDGIL